MPLDRIRSNGYAFQVEMAFVASRLGFRFAETPIYFADRQWGHSKMSFRIQREAALPRLGDALAVPRFTPTGRAFAPDLSQDHACNLAFSASVGRG